MNEAAEEIVKSYLVKVTDDGVCTLLDAAERPVTAYLAVDPSQTKKGKDALFFWSEAQKKLEVAKAVKEAEDAEKLRTLLASMSVQEALERLEREDDDD